MLGSWGLNSLLAKVASTRQISLRTMVTPNYSFEKRRRELDKKAKKEEKRKQKLEAHAAAKESGNAPDALDVPANDESDAPEDSVD